MDTGRVSGANTSQTPRASVRTSARPANPCAQPVAGANTGSRPVNTPADTDFRAEHIDLSRFARVSADADGSADVVAAADACGYVINISGGSVTINLYCDN